MKIQREVFSQRAQQAKKGVMAKLRRADFFGEQIKLTFQGDFKYRTNFGAILTFICFTVLFIYASSQLTNVITGQIITV